MNEFHKKTKGLAQGKYMSVMCEIDNDGKVRFGCYIEDVGWIYGDSTEDIIKQLQVDVEVDMDDSNIVVKSDDFTPEEFDELHPGRKELTPNDQDDDKKSNYYPDLPF